MQQELDFNNPKVCQYLRKKCLSDFMFYVKLFFKISTGLDFVVNWHHIEIAKHLVAVFRGQIKYLMILQPPQTGKTELAVIMFITWCMAHNPRARFMHLSKSDLLVHTNSYKIREIINLPEYKALFGVELRKDNRRVTQFLNEQNGGLYAASMGGQIAGFPAGVIGDSGNFSGFLSWDDLLKPEDKHSPVARLKANRRAMQTKLSRRATENTPIVFTQQSLHQNDPGQFMLQQVDRSDWVVLKIPGLINSESFWPWKYSTKTLMEAKQQDKYVFAAEIMQDPIPEGGAIYREEYWQFYETLPDIEYIEGFADTAQKTGQANDFTVFQIWGYAKNRIYLIDQVRVKLEAPELKTRFVALYNKYKGKVPGIPQLDNATFRKFYVEDKSSGTGLIQQIKREGGIPIAGIPRNKDKVTRAQDSVGQIEAGNVYLPTNAQFLNDYLIEFLHFPNGEHDDQVDCTNDAIDKMLNSGKSRLRVAVL